MKIIIREGCGQDGSVGVLGAGAGTDLATAITIDLDAMRTSGQFHIEQDFGRGIVQISRTARECFDRSLSRLRADIRAESVYVTVLPVQRGQVHAVGYLRSDLRGSSQQLLRSQNRSAQINAAIVGPRHPVV